MHVGVFIWNGLEGSQALSIAREAETLGFESIFCPEHTHFPVSVERPPRFARMGDPFITLAAIASVTSKLLLGTAVCLIAQRRPILFAKTVATLDQISDGRVLLGVGTGWNEEEMRNDGVEPSRRTATMIEHIQAVKEIWANDVASFQGELVKFGPLYSWPKPAQTPRPPILVGGAGPGVLKRVVEFGDGWIPGHDGDLAALGARIAELRIMAEFAGRPRPSVTIMHGQTAFLERYLEMGVDRAVLELPPATLDASLKQLRELASLAQLAAA